MTTEYKLPVKVIKTPEIFEQFKLSETYKGILGFIKALSDSVKRKSNYADCEVSQTVEGILQMLDTLSKYIDESPPIEQPMRYGNKAYRTWFEKMEENIDELHKNWLPEDKHNAIIELSAYIKDSFGSKVRLDYGTALGVVNQQDFTALVLKVFLKYLNLVRKLQQTYGLEPAGSHGVWSLDDYQFVPFIWGAAQLLDNETISPSSVTKDEIIDSDLSNEFMYLGCIKYIMDVKRPAPFYEHSPDLYNISSAASWFKINNGMQKKYIDDVMKKFPILQHFLFGSIIDFTPNIEN